MRCVLVGLVVALVSACSDSHGRDNPSDGSVPVDAVILADATADASTSPDAAVVTECDVAWDVAIDPCVNIDADCDPNADDVYYWNGERCARFDACTGCSGADCARLGSLEACEAAYASCESVLCAATGGFYRAEHLYCGALRCGLDTGDDCLETHGACDCGASGVFDPELGCLEDAAPCSDAELCRATHGDWGPFCVGPCGELLDPGPTGGICADACLCGDGLVFDRARGGCVEPLIDLCESPSDESLCGRTGGSWVSGCAESCGLPSVCDCDDCEACNCGRLGRFDRTRGGCVRDETCPDYARANFGDACGQGALLSECEPGSVCCTNGIGTSQCEAPVCSEFGPCGPPRP